MINNFLYNATQSNASDKLWNGAAVGAVLTALTYGLGVTNPITLVAVAAIGQLSPILPDARICAYFRERVIDTALDKGDLDMACSLLYLTDLDNKDTLRAHALKANQEGTTTLLHYTIEKDETALAAAIIESLDAEELSTQDSAKLTALNRAIERNQPETALPLIKKLGSEQLSAPIQHNGILFKMTPLHQTIRYLNDPAIGLALIKKLGREQLSIQDNYQRTPLHLAITANIRDRFWDDRQILKKNLIKKLTDKQLSIQDENGNTPLHLSIKYFYQPKAALALIERLPPKRLSIQNNEGQTPLHLAIGQCHLDPEARAFPLIKSLAEKLEPAQCWLQNNNGETPWDLIDVVNCPRKQEIRNLLLSEDFESDSKHH